MNTDILIIGCGCSGLYCALNLPRDKRVLVLSKEDCESSDSFLAQGGMCMLTGEDDYDAYMKDTLVAGHYKNDIRSVEIMIRSSQDVVSDLLEIGTDFKRDENGRLVFTREGAHSSKRILFHEDETGKEITSKLLAEARKRENITISENTVMLDLIADEFACGAVCRLSDGSIEPIFADYTVLATGGIGGLYEHSTNFRCLTGDGIAVCAKHGVKLRDMGYVQIHPTTLYGKSPEERSFLISESVRGEGAKLYNKAMERFVDELLPRDLLTQRIYAQMKSDDTEHVWEDLRTIDPKELKSHFPNIVAHCATEGYDATRECIPVVPAQHYFMGGIEVGYESETSMSRLYAVGETACNGVHGANRLASNSLLESLVFAKRCAKSIEKNYSFSGVVSMDIDVSQYENEEEYSLMLAEIVKNEIIKDRKAKDLPEMGGLRGL